MSQKLLLVLPCGYRGPRTLISLRVSQGIRRELTQGKYLGYKPVPIRNGGPTDWRLAHHITAPAQKLFIFLKNLFYLFLEYRNRDSEKFLCAGLLPKYQLWLSQAEAGTLELHLGPPTGVQAFKHWTMFSL